jgi:hypothetical protein
MNPMHRLDNLKRNSTKLVRLVRDEKNMPLSFLQSSRSWSQSSSRMALANLHRSADAAVCRCCRCRRCPDSSCQMHNHSLRKQDGIVTIKGNIKSKSCSTLVDFFRADLFRDVDDVRVADLLGHGHALDVLVQVDKSLVELGREAPNGMITLDEIGN